jgi:hypothetical protein
MDSRLRGQPSAAHKALVALHLKWFGVTEARCASGPLSVLCGRASDRAMPSAYARTGTFVMLGA